MGVGDIQIKTKCGIVLTYDAIRRITGFAPKTISMAIKELVRINYIDIDFFGSYPHNVTVYQVNMNILSRKYPKIDKSIPEYLRKDVI